MSHIKSNRIKTTIPLRRYRSVNLAARISIQPTEDAYDWHNFHFGICLLFDYIHTNTYTRTQSININSRTPFGRCPYNIFPLNCKIRPNLDLGLHSAGFVSHSGFVQRSNFEMWMWCDNEHLMVIENKIVTFQEVSCASYVDNSIGDELSRHTEIEQLIQMTDGNGNKEQRCIEYNWIIESGDWAKTKAFFPIYPFIRSFVRPFFRSFDCCVSIGEAWQLLIVSVIRG